MIEAGPAEALARTVVDRSVSSGVSRKPSVSSTPLRCCSSIVKSGVSAGADMRSTRPATNHRGVNVCSPCTYQPVATVSAPEVSIVSRTHSPCSLVKRNENSDSIVTIVASRFSVTVGRLVGSLPSAVRHRCADAQTDERRDATADHDVVEARRICAGEDASGAQRRRIDDGDSCVPPIAETRGVRAVRVDRSKQRRTRSTDFCRWQRLKERGGQ